jgi:DNA-binding transcriptional LysR family regulator
LLAISCAALYVRGEDPPAVVMRMELRHLRYLVAIADAGAFVRAAERLRVAQPALTRQMHDLEEELGAPLFESGARRATLTLAGKACVRLAQHVIQDTEKAVARARLSNSGVIGRCVLATGPLPLASGLVPEFVARMRRSFPGITIVVVERSGHEQWNAIDRAEADIGLGGEPVGDFATLSVAMQFVNKMDSVAVSSKHALARRDTVALDDLLAEPLLCIEPGFSPVLDRVIAALEATLREMGRDRLERRQFTSIESLGAHVRAGQGWTLAPSAMASVLPGVKLLKLTGFQAVFPTMRIWRRAETRPVVLTVLDQLRLFQENRDAASERDAAPNESDRDDVPPRIELRHLRSFLSVAEYGSLGRAAEIVGLTQPALSRQMRELEYDVGVALFSRESRGMEITAAGETFRDDVGDVLSVVDKIPREIRRAQRAQTHRCVIGVVPHSAVDAMVSRVVADVEERGERVRVGTRLIMSVRQADALHAGEIDISLTYAFPVTRSPAAGEHLTVIPLFDDRIAVALLPDGHPLTARKVLQARELGPIPFVWMRRDLYPAFYDVVLARFAVAGLIPRAEGDFEGLNTMWSMVRQGAGWTLGWESQLNDPPPGLTAIRIGDFDLPWGIVMTHRQDEARVPVLATIDALVAHAKQLAPVKAPESTLAESHIPRVRIS